MPSGLSAASFLAPLLSGAASSLIGGLFGKDQAQPQQAGAAPVAEPVTPMPTQTDAERAKQKSIVAQMQRQGRASTILTAGNASTNDAMG